MPVGLRAPRNRENNPSPQLPSPSSLSLGRGKRGWGERVRGLGWDFQSSGGARSSGQRRIGTQRHTGRQTGSGSESALTPPTRTSESPPTFSFPEGQARLTRPLSACQVLTSIMFRHLTKLVCTCTTSLSGVGGRYFSLSSTIRTANGESDVGEA